MRVLRVACLALALSWPIVVMGQTVQIRSGEHESFTRLVFRLPERVDFSVDRQVGEVTLAFEAEDWTYDVASVFDRVPRTRLTDLQVASGSKDVTLSLACKCGIETFWFEESALVVDIRDETSESAALYPDRTATSVPSVTEIEAPEEARSGNEILVESSTPPTAQSPGVGSVAYLIADAFDRSTAPIDLAQQASEAMDERADRLRENQAAIIEHIGRAASQGLLSPRLPNGPSSQIQETQPDSLADPVTVEPRNVSSTPLEQNVSISAQTSLDQALSRRMQLETRAIDASGCLARREVDVTSWSEGDDFNSQIGPLRTALVGEFDSLSPEAVSDLAKFYIHFGFGVEAGQVLRLMPDRINRHSVLMAMSQILEYGHAQDGSVLSGFMDCEPMVAAWSALSYPEIPGNLAIDPDAVLRGFLEFPVHLRAHLGPTLGQRMRAAGHSAPADHIARNLLRREDTTTPAANLLGANKIGSGTQTQLSQEQLSNVVAADAAPSAEALGLLVDAMIKKKETVPVELAELAGSYAIEYRNLPLGPTLNRAYILALAASGDFDQAFWELERLADGQTGTPHDIESAVMGLLNDRAPDPVFLSFSIGAPQSTKFALDDDVANAIATRLLSLGFVDIAAQYVVPLAQSSFESDRRLLRARIALANKRPRQAELELLGMTGEDAKLLRAEAHSIAGEHATASNLFSETQNHEDAMRQAWIGGDWHTLQDHDTSAIASFANRMINVNVSEGFEDNEILARNAAILEDSRDMRTEINALLNAMQTPELPN